MMRFWTILRYELSLQTRRPTVWVYVATLLGISGVVSFNALKDARAGDALFDAPVEVASVMLLASVAGLLTSAALAADTATRDTTTRMEPLLFTTPLRQHEYLGGRFIAAFMLYALALLSVTIGYMLVRLLAPAELVGPFQPRTFINAFVFISLPNAFIATAILFAAAALTRRALASYVTAAVMLVGTMLSFQMAISSLASWQYAGLLDPLAFGALSRMAAAWTPAQRSVLPLAFEGELLWNRVLWVSLACVVLGAAFWALGVSATRRFGGVAGWSFRRREATVPQLLPSRQAVEPPVIPQAQRHFALATSTRQMLAIARRAFLDVATSWGALVIVAFALMHVVTGPELMEHLGVPLHPTTAAVVRVLTATAGTGITLLAALLTIFYAGELVWKERDLRLAPLTGAAPVSGWSVLLGKFLGLSLVLVIFELLLVIAGIATQATLGYRTFDPLLYVQTLLGLQLAELLLFAALAVTVQVIAGGKYVGWLAAALAWAVIAWPDIGIEHRMLVYTSDPGWSYSGMSGFSASLSAVLWFTAYWAAWASLLMILARLFVVRGIDLPWSQRLSRARQRFTRRTALGTLGAAGAVVGLGGFIFWNTNILNEYRPESERLGRSAEYERRYGVFEMAPQPTHVATSLRVELHPSKGTATLHGRYVLRNDTNAPLDTLHVELASQLETRSLEFDRATETALIDSDFGHRMYVLRSPLAAGDSLELAFDLRYAPRGFSNEGASDAVVENGTYFELNAWLPAIGYQPHRALVEAHHRREHGLPPRAVPGPDDPEASARMTGRERVRYDVIIGTEEGQTAVSAGLLKRSWTENGRSHFEYEAPIPIGTRIPILSARYAVLRSQWQGIPIEVLHHPRHPWNAERIAESAAASLAHFTRTIGPYPYEMIRVIERPGAQSGATAFPGLVAYSEPIALMHPEADVRELDFQFAVLAHEMAHQWWGNQFEPSSVSGAALLSESLAWYGAFGVIEEVHGSRHLQSLLNLMHEAYLQPMPRANPPVVYANDWFLAYRKGAFAMHAAREYLGAQQVDDALRRMFEAHVDGRLPHPTSLDLYARLTAVAPDSLKSVLHDLFKANVWWDLAIRRATAERLPTGGWKVQVVVRAAKAAVDTLGSETLLPLDEIVEIALYGEDISAEPMYLRTHRIREREQTIVLTVPEMPTHAAVNPRHLLVDDVLDGDRRPVVVVRSGG